MNKLYLLAVPGAALCCFVAAAPENDLFDAVRKDDREACARALSAGADINRRAQTQDGAYLPQPLMRAAENGSVRMLMFLPARGANANATNFGGENALFYAILAPEPKRLETFRYLAEHTDINLWLNSPRSGTPLAAAQRRGAQDIVQYILGQSPEPTRTTTAPTIQKREEVPAGDCPVTLDMLRKQQAKTTRCREVWKKEARKCDSLMASAQFHSEEAGIWDDVSADLGGLTQGNENRRQNEHRKARNKKNRATAVSKQRVAPLKHAYERELKELRDMIKVYNKYHPNHPYRER